MIWCPIDEMFQIYSYFITFLVRIAQHKSFHFSSVQITHFVSHCSFHVEFQGWNLLHIHSILFKKIEGHGKSKDCLHYNYTVLDKKISHPHNMLIEFRKEIFTVKVRLSLVLALTFWIVQTVHARAIEVWHSLLWFYWYSIFTPGFPFTLSLLNTIKCEGRKLKATLKKVMRG